MVDAAESAKLLNAKFMSTDSLAEAVNGHAAIKERFLKLLGEIGHHGITVQQIDDVFVVIKNCLGQIDQINPSINQINMIIMGLQTSLIMASTSGLGIQSVLRKDDELAVLGNTLTLIHVMKGTSMPTTE